MNVCVSDRGCSLPLSRSGPFTAFIPLLKTPLTVGSLSVGICPLVYLNSPFQHLHLLVFSLCPWGFFVKSVQLRTKCWLQQLKFRSHLRWIWTKPILLGNFNCVRCYWDSAGCDIQCRLAAALSLDTPDGLKLKFNACLTRVHLGNQWSQLETTQHFLLVGSHFDQNHWHIPLTPLCPAHNSHYISSRHQTKLSYSLTKVWLKIHTQCSSLPLQDIFELNSLSSIDLLHASDTLLGSSFPREKDFLLFLWSFASEHNVTSAL